MTIHKFIKKGKKNNKPYNYDELSQCLFFINAYLALYTLTSVKIFSTLFSIHSYSTDKENLFNNPELLYLVIIPSIPITSMFVLGLILIGEISC